MKIEYNSHKTAVITKGKDSDDLLFFCPGCQDVHAYRIRGGSCVWQFNGDLEAPTLSPSLLCRGDDPHRRCHLFLRDGVIEFCRDSHHDLRGQRSPLPRLPDHWVFGDGDSGREEESDSNED